MNLKRHALTLLTPLFFLSACAPASPGDAGSNPADDGVLEVTQYVVPAGTTQTVTRDLAVFASEGIRIEGTLEVKAGVSLALFSEGDVVVTGEIMGGEEEAPAVAAGFSFQDLLLGKAIAAPGELPDWILYGDGIAIAKGATVRSGKDSEVLITTHDANGKIEIDGKVQTPDGRDARNRDENGADGPSIQIGTQVAIDNIKYKAKKLGKGLDTAQPGYVRVAGSVVAGNGGDGFTDLKGVEAEGKLDLRGTNGGAGGDVAINGDKLELTGTIEGGQGGNGGGAGDPALRDGTHARDGVKDGEKGFDLNFVTGSGGHGGNLELQEGPIGKAKEVEAGEAGRGGNAGWAYASAGNGSYWGAGGNLSGKFGNIGGNGRLNSRIGSSNEAQRASGTFRNGGNGGYSNNKSRPGGNGGTLYFTNPDGGKADLSQAVSFDNYGNGGFGYIGCGVPLEDGTDGGNSFNNPVIPLSVYGAPYVVASRSFSGGDGGDGVNPGRGGFGGFDDAFNQVGPNGKDGRPCKKVAAVILDHPLQGYAMGQTIPLDRIQGYSIGEPEIGGCATAHLHAGAGETITIDGNGPYFDPNPSACGFGAVIME